MCRYYIRLYYYSFDSGALYFVKRRKTLPEHAATQLVNESSEKYHASGDRWLPYGYRINSYYLSYSEIK